MANSRNYLFERAFEGYRLFFIRNVNCVFEKPVFSVKLMNLLPFLSEKCRFCKKNTTFVTILTQVD